MQSLQDVRRSFYIELDKPIAESGFRAALNSLIWLGLLMWFGMAFSGASGSEAAPWLLLVWACIAVEMAGRWYWMRLFWISLAALSAHLVANGAGASFATTTLEVAVVMFLLSFPGAAYCRFTDGI